MSSSDSFASKPHSERVVVQNTTRREIVLAILAGIAIFGFVGYGVYVMTGMQEKASTNTLSGAIIAKHFTPAPEEQITVGRRAGIQQQHIAGDYVLEVKVKSENNRVFEVPVDGNTYDAVKIGGSFSFLRPRSEQVK